jgi:arylsulfatase A-like enzyme
MIVMFGPLFVIFSALALHILANGSDFVAVYDLNTDPTELFNLVEDEPSLVHSNDKLLQSLQKKNILGEMDLPDYTMATEAWGLLGGTTPWINISISEKTAKPIVDEIYSYSAAPNIVFFLVDDWGMNDIGYHSTYMNWTTPNIDSAIRQGITLDNYFTHERCIPSRAALMTGKYAARFGMHGADLKVELPIAETTLAEELKSAGYRTYLM